MDFQYTPEQEAYRAKVKTWLEANQPGKIEQADPESLGDDRLWNRLKDWHTRLYKGGWMGLTWPKEYGGQQATFIEQVIFQQELGKLNLPFGVNVLGVIMTGPALMQWGTDEQKKRYLEPIIAGKEIWCEGMSEPGAGSDLADDTSPVGVADDPDYVEGGGDSIVYRLAAADLAGKKPTAVQATLYYQATPPYFLQDRFCTARGDDTRRLYYMAGKLPLAATSAQGWKLRVVTSGPVDVP